MGNVVAVAKNRLISSTGITVGMAISLQSNRALPSENDQAAQYGISVYELPAGLEHVEVSTHQIRHKTDHFNIE